MINSGDQFGSTTVVAFESVSASRMAVIGRQNSLAYLVFQAAMLESLMAMFKVAKRRAFSPRLKFLSVAIWVAI